MTDLAFVKDKIATLLATLEELKANGHLETELLQIQRDLTDDPTLLPQLVITDIRDLMAGLKTLKDIPLHTPKKKRSTQPIDDIVL